MMVDVDVLVIGVLVLVTVVEVDVNNLVEVVVGTVEVDVVVV